MPPRNLQASEPVCKSEGAEVALSLGWRIIKSSSSTNPAVSYSTLHPLEVSLEIVYYTFDRQPLISQYSSKDNSLKEESVCNVGITPTYAIYYVEMVALSDEVCCGSDLVGRFALDLLAKIG